LKLVPVVVVATVMVIAVVVHNVLVDVRVLADALPCAGDRYDVV
jgi:hypothetical protein